MSDSIRIFQLAKELNISHNDIVEFLKQKGVDVSSHMSPIDGKTQQIVYTEFSKDRQSAERDRKEQVRKEIHDSRVVMKSKSVKNLKILSVKEEKELQKAKPKVEITAPQDSEDLSKEKTEKAPTKSPKKKLRKISLREPESPQEKQEKRHEKNEKKSDASAVKRLKKNLASIETSPKKKNYKKLKKDTKVLDENTVYEIAEFSSISEIAKVFDVSTSELIGKCLQLGILATVNQRLEWDVIELIADEYGVAVKKYEEMVDDLFVTSHTDEELKTATSRAPVVTIMGHVDHGKTSILDYIRETKVAAGESGGITQRVGAYHVIHNNQKITFLDTPGHEAFTAMRARGAQSTDIVILVVAADSVMPQTIEAIDHAKAANVPIVVAINKMDKPGANPDIVKRELSEKNVLVEEWGGKIQSVNTSAKTGEGIDALMEAILLEAEVLDLKANSEVECKGIVIDSRLDKGLGPIATVLIQKGTLKIGTAFICNNASGKVRAIMTENNERIKVAKPSDAVQILGFDQVPQAGDIFAEVENESDLKKIAGERKRIKREIDLQMMRKTTLDTLSAQIKEGSISTLNVIIKADSDGSIEAIIQSLEKIKNEEVGVSVVHKGVGNVTDSDILLAQASKAIVIGFAVQVSSDSKLLASQNDVEIRTYSVIYKLVEEISLAVEGLLTPDVVEDVLGQAVVKESFKIPKIGFIAGCQVESGQIKRDCFVRHVRDGEILVSKSTISSLKRFKDDVNSVESGMECGIAVEGVNKYEPGDQIVAYKIREVKRTLK
jgi:translation initiation factor IF-2